MGRTYFRVLAVFYLAFGLITTFSPRLMQLFMTEKGVEASTPFSDQLWLHEGLDILSVAILLFAFTLVPTTRVALRAAAAVALLPVMAIVYTFLATPFWSPLFLAPAAAAFALAAWGFGLTLPRGGDARSAVPVTGL